MNLQPPTPRRRGRWAAFAACAAIAVTSVATAAGSSTVSAAAPRQIEVWNHTGSQTASSYWEPTLRQPSSYTSPVDYANGRAYLKLVVQQKPSSKAMIPQVCFWTHAGSQKFKYETCARTKSATFTKTGTYYLDLGAPASWWKKGGRYNWSTKSSVGRIMLKDPATGKLFLSSKCGAACYRGGDLGSHIPVKMTSQLILVAKGATFVPPPGW